MRTLLSLALISLCFSLSAQETITYPYNPDWNADGAITSPDLLDLLGVYGNAFTPTEIQIDGVGLAEVLNQLLTTQAEMQETISALEAENLTQAELITELQNSSGGGIEGLENYLSVDEATNTVLISGANLQVVSGGGSTDATVNGTGNIIIGYDENVVNDKSGSHNLVVGQGHTYSSYGGIVVGYNNSITGEFSSVSGGYGNTAEGTNSSVSGGGANTASEDMSSVSGGQFNTAEGNFSSVSGGKSNIASGEYSSVSGGQYNTASGDYSSVSGGRNNNASGFFSSVSGGKYNTAEGYWSSVSGDPANTFLGNSAEGNTID